MKTISKRFVAAHNGKPASRGNLNREVIPEPSDEERDGDVIPLGELYLTIDAEYLLEWREERESLGYTYEQIAADEAIEFTRLL